MADKKGSIAGAIPCGLLTQSVKSLGFQSVAQHVRSRTTSSSSATSTDPRYQCFSFDTLTNLCATHNDTRMIVNRGLTIGNDDSAGGLGVRCKNDSAFSESADNKETVRNLSAAQKYHEKTHFATYTVNQKKHFGVSPIRNWLDSCNWHQYYPDFYKLTPDEREEITKALHESAAIYYLRNWNEVTKLFINYIRKSPSSPFCKVGSIFARCEYQKDVGNLHHIHLILQVEYDLLTEEQIDFVNNLVRASVLDVVRPHEVSKLIEEGVFKCIDDYTDMQNDAKSMLSHVCGSRCVRITNDGKFVCRKLNNLLEACNDPNLTNTRDSFKDLPNNFSDATIEVLVKCGLAVQPEENEHGFKNNFKSNLDFFHPKRHIPATNPCGDTNMSPVEGYTFSVCRSMQNLQILVGTGGVNKYVCKYIGKIDETNYVVIKIDGHGRLVTRAHFLHNTKVTSTKIQEDKVREKENRNSNAPQGRIISQMEMLHLILQYPEVYTDLNFVRVCTLPLELRAGTPIKASKNIYAEDGAYLGPKMVNLRQHAQLDDWRQISESETLVLEDIAGSTVSIDKITQFSVRPPELRSVFNQVGNYFRWFSIGSIITKDSDIMTHLSPDLEKSSWIDGLQRQIKVRKKALPEILQYLQNEYFEDTEYNGVVIDLFQDIVTIIQKDHDGTELLSNREQDFLEHIKENLLEEDDGKEHLPVPVFSSVKPTLGVQFILHLMLSLGKF
jgi:hypothetical protein